MTVSAAHHLHRHLNVTYKTALIMVRRLEPLIAAAVWELMQMTNDEAGEPPSFGRRRVRWQRRRHGALPVRDTKGDRPQEEESVPWVYPAPPPDPAFRAFGAMVHDFGCLEDEAVFDAMLGRIARSVPTPAPV